MISKVEVKKQKLQKLLTPPPPPPVAPRRLLLVAATAIARKSSTTNTTTYSSDKVVGSFHPINDAEWKKGEKIPYRVICIRKN